MLIELEIDTDNNAATGSPEGADYAIELLQGEIFLYRWDGENFTRRAGDPPAASLIFTYQGGATLRSAPRNSETRTVLLFNTIVIAGSAIDPVPATSTSPTRRPTSLRPSAPALPVRGQDCPGAAQRAELLDDPGEAGGGQAVRDAGSRPRAPTRAPSCREAA